MFNPARNFTLFILRHSPIIHCDGHHGRSCAVGLCKPAQHHHQRRFHTLIFDNSGNLQLDVFQSSAPEQSRYYPRGTFTTLGVTPGDSSSFGYPNSKLRVAAPEPRHVRITGRWPVRIARPASPRKSEATGVLVGSDRRIASITLRRPALPASLAAGRAGGLPGRDYHAPRALPVAPKLLIQLSHHLAPKQQRHERADRRHARRQVAGRPRLPVVQRQVGFGQPVDLPGFETTTIPIYPGVAERDKA